VATRLHSTNTCTCDDDIPRNISITEPNLNKISFHQSLSGCFEELSTTPFQPHLQTLASKQARKRTNTHIHTHTHTHTYIYIYIYIYIYTHTILAIPVISSPAHIPRLITTIGALLSSTHLPHTIGPLNISHTHTNIHTHTKSCFPAFYFVMASIEFNVKPL